MILSLSKPTLFVSSTSLIGKISSSSAFTAGMKLLVPCKWVLKLSGFTGAVIVDSTAYGSKLTLWSNERCSAHALARTWNVYS